jgi:hypothetical protein
VPSLTPPTGGERGGFTIVSGDTAEAEQVPPAFGANIDERRAVAESEAQVGEVADLLRTGCSVPTLKVTIAWSEYAAFSDADFEGRTRANVYGIAGAQITGDLRFLAEHCSDPLVRSAVQGLHEIAWHPRVGPVDAAHPSHVYTVHAGVLTARYHVSTSNGDADRITHAL